MGPCFVLLLAALACCLIPASCCVTCEPSVMEAVKSLEKGYLPGHLEAKDREKVMDMVYNTLKDFQDRPFIEGSYAGIIDKNSLEEVSRTLLKELKRITDSNVKGLCLALSFRPTLAGEYSLDLAPPGVMLQTLIWCRNCEKEVHTCLKSKTCGERHVEVHEMEDMILDCLLTWHHISEGLTDYKFYRVWENNSETLLYKGKESTLTKPSVTEADEGKYRCQLDTVKSGPATIISYHVTVIPPNAGEEKPGSHIVTEEEGGNIPVIPDQPETMITTTTTHSSDTETRLQNILFWLLISFSIFLIVALILRQVTAENGRAGAGAVGRATEVSRELVGVTAWGAYLGGPGFDSCLNRSALWGWELGSGSQLLST
uniref:Ig-like domain-containing protein n=1 Tax=Spermophilus dauricus TaxID=99837 RepID=A0A8C9P8D5_SPEDA